MYLCIFYNFTALFSMLKKVVRWDGSHVASSHVAVRDDYVLINVQYFGIKQNTNLTKNTKKKYITK